MKVNSNVEFDKTINLPVDTIKVNSDAIKEEVYLLEKVQDQKKYKMAIVKNSESKSHYDITDIAMYVSDSLEVTEITNKILKDIFIRNRIMNGNLVYHNILMMNNNNLLKSIKEVESEEELPQKQKNTKGIFANVKEKEKANSIVKARLFTRKKLEETQRYELLTVNRLGTINDYTKNFYSTLKPEFEANMLDKFYSLYQKGKIYKENKPVYWCKNCKSSSDHVKYVLENKNVSFILYRIKDDHYLFAKYSNLRNTYFVGTTILPWTLVYSNYLVIIPEKKYSLVEVKTDFAKNHYIIASDFVEYVMKEAEIKEYTILEEIAGEELKWCLCQDPLDYTNNIAIIGSKEEYVVPDKKHSSGIRILSNCHSYIDYLIYKENRLEDEIKNILDIRLNTSSLSRQFKNMYYKNVNDEVIAYLTKAMFLFSNKEHKIKVPKCKICNEDLVYRFVNEWYVKKDEEQLVKQRELGNIIPKVVQNKNVSIEKLKDYLNKIYDVQAVQISEEKLFGVPLPVFSCGECGNVILTSESLDYIKKIVSSKKVEEWYKMTPEEILQKNVKCDKCGCDFFFKEDGVLSDFFKILSMPLTLVTENEDENGKEDKNIIIEPKSKFLEKIKALSFDNDISSEIQKVDKVLMHGMALDDEVSLTLSNIVNKNNIAQKSNVNANANTQNTTEAGNANSKFLINDIMNKYGTDILRLWISHKYVNSKISLKQSEIKQEKYVYNFLRMTFKYLLSNLQNFNPIQNYIEVSNREDLDKYMYIELSNLVTKIKENYENLKINEVYELLTDFCINKLCRTYFDSIKYRLYILKSNNHVRLSTLSTMYDILMMLIMYLEPIVPFLIEEVYPYIWLKDKTAEKNVLNLRDDFEPSKYAFVDEYKKWDRIFKFKTKMKRVLGSAQKKKIIGNTLQAKVIISTNKEAKKFIDDNYDDILRSINVSQMIVQESDKERVAIEKAEGVECARCKNYAIDIGKNLKYRYLCPKCAEIMEEN